MSGPEEIASAPRPPWRKTVRVLFFVHLLTSAGFSLVLPFLPMYVKKLGIETAGSVTFWSGVIFSGPALTMMISAPFWGFLADRHGRKLMLVRSTIAGAVLLGLMGFVRSAEELAVLRALQGFLTGNIAASNALVASTIPRERAGESLGFLRTATWLGMGVGPVLGGTIGGLVGFRQSFWVTSLLLALGGILVVCMVKESFTPQKKADQPGFWSAYARLFRSRGLRRLYAISFLHSMGRSIILPILPLFVLTMMPGSRGGAMSTGVLFGLKAAAGVVAGMYLGRLGDHIGHGRVVLTACVMMVIFYIPQPFVTQVWQLVALQAVTGFAAVGIIPGVSALFSLYLPRGSAGATFGLESSVDALARTIGPMVGAAVGLWVGLSSVFWLAGLVYVGVVVLAAPLYSVVKVDAEATPAAGFTTVR